MSVMDVQHITKKFGSFVALNGVTFQLEKGEVYGFIGPNGAGKSTTLRILLGIVKATSGEATIFGKNVWKEAVSIHEKVSYVPGDVHLWDNLTGGEVIDFFLRLKGTVNKGKRDALIERFQLDPTKKCGTYSKGNRQKVALISAFASPSELFILDEPTSGLDPLMEQVFQQCVMEAKEEGKSVLLSSHILSEVEKLCDTVGIIRNGEIIESGTLQQLRHLTRSKIIVQTKRPIDTLHTLAGVHDMTKTNEQYELQVDAENLSEVMKQLSEHQITYIESLPPTLEELFIQHYEVK
ncbi:ATP-binding cassette domain-containing protein [Gracilibacillus marinus]|uniref:ATP-binding cassette domain-containing protein n=1 Tax=Gracilibacillus marinus TaxID=630535 RepID=A0ABV8W0X6_9BACI